MKKYPIILAVLRLAPLAALAAPERPNVLVIIAGQSKGVTLET